MSLIFHFREDGRVLHFLPGVSRLARRSSPRTPPVHCYIRPLFRQRGFLIAKNYAILVNFGGFVRIFDGVRPAIVPSSVVKVRDSFVWKMSPTWLHVGAWCRNNAQCGYLAKHLRRRYLSRNLDKTWLPQEIAIEKDWLRSFSREDLSWCSKRRLGSPENRSFLFP